jgi:hypothetical protein
MTNFACRYISTFCLYKLLGSVVAFVAHKSRRMSVHSFSLGWGFISVLLRWFANNLPQPFFGQNCNRPKLFYSLLFNIYPENKAAEKECLHYSVTTLAQVSTDNWTGQIHWYDNFKKLFFEARNHDFFQMFPGILCFLLSRLPLAALVLHP